MPTAPSKKYDLLRSIVDKYENAGQGDHPNAVKARRKLSTMSKPSRSGVSVGLPASMPKLGAPAVGMSQAPTQTQQGPTQSLIAASQRPDSIAQSANTIAGAYQGFVDQFKPPEQAGGMSKMPASMPQQKTMVPEGYGQQAPEPSIAGSYTATKKKMEAAKPKAAAPAAAAAGPQGRSMYEASSIGDAHNRVLQKTIIEASRAARERAAAGFPLQFTPVYDSRNNVMYFSHANGTRHAVDLNSSEGHQKMQSVLSKTGLTQQQLMQWADQTSRGLEQFLDPNMKQYQHAAVDMSPTNTIAQLMERPPQTPEELEQAWSSM